MFANLRLKKRGTAINSSAATILTLPVWENATDDLVPVTGSWVNQCDTEPLLLWEGDTFPTSINGTRARWNMIDN